MRWQLYLPVLSEGEYERGNVRRNVKGESALMDTDAADAIPQGRRQQRRGLVYDENFEGCSPAAWPHTCFPPPHGGMGGRRFLLGGYGEGVGDTIVDVAYSPCIDTRMASFAESAIAAHVRTCRGDEPGTGGMMGMGSHMRRTGFVGDFIVRDGAARQHACATMEFAGRALTSHFSGRGVGFEGMLEEQHRLWPHAPPWPICWNVSFELSNAMHVDLDGWRSYALWVSRLGYAGLGQSSRWWLLFPRHGLAIALVHGTYVSWDGRVQHHCSAVPDVAPGDRLLSLFCTLPADAVKAKERALNGMASLREGGPVFARLEIDMPVRFRQVDPRRASDPQLKSKAAKRAWGKAHLRFVRSIVVDLSDTHAVLRVECSGACHVLSKAEVNNIVVVGWG